MTRSGLEVTEAWLTPALLRDRRRGLLGYVRCVLNGSVVLDGITVRRTLDGRLTLSFPRGRGQRPPVRPLDDEARRALERGILGAIGLGAGGER